MNKRPHLYAGFLSEAFQDMNRLIEGSYKGSSFVTVKLSDVIVSGSGWVFRFADTDPKAPVVRSGLSDDDIRSIFRNHAYPNNTAEMVDDLRGCRAIANAAAQEIVKRIMGLDAVTMYEVSGGGYSRIQVIAFMNDAIKHFLANLPVTLEETK